MVRISLILTFILSIGYPCAWGEETQPARHRVWRITILKATNLKNLDWGKRKVSDPYVEIREYNSGVSIGEGRAFEKAKFVFYDKHPRRYAPRIEGERKVASVTKVVEDDLSPTWNHSVTTRRYPSEGLRQLTFFVLDKDPAGHQFLGAASLDNASPGTYSLQLSRLFSTKKSMPGTLTVKIEVETPDVSVPSVVGLTRQAAANAFSKQCLRMAVSERFVPGKPISTVVGQSIPAGRSIPMDSVVTIYLQKGRTYPVPVLTGLTPFEARRKLFGFPVKFVYDPASGANTDQWYKVIKQSPPATTRIYRTQPITLTVYQPMKGTEVTVPNVIDMPVSQARHALEKVYLRKIEYQRQEAERKKAGRVLAQVPVADTKCAFDDPTGVKLTVGYYADGCSYESAKTIGFDTPFSCDLEKKNPTPYRKITVKEPGYLRIGSSVEFASGVFPRVTVYSGPDSALGSGDLKRSVRVEPGTYVMAFSAPSVEPLKEPISFTCSFLPEIDTAEPNDSLETAAALTESCELALGFCTNRDNDYYRFTLSEPQYVMIKAAGDKASLDALEKIDPAGILFNEKGERLARGGLPQLHWLPKGTYYLCLYGGDLFYSEPCAISVAFLKDHDKTEPNDTPEQASPLVAGQSIRVRYTTDDVDHYAIESKEPGYVLISHPYQLGPYTSLSELDDKGEVVHSQEGERAFFAIRIDGKKIVRMTTTQQYRKAPSYEPVSLNTFFMPLKADPQEPNDTAKTAASVPVNQAFEGLMIPNDDQDCYRFTVGQPGEVRMGLAEDSISLSLSGRLYRSDGSPVDEKWHDLPWTTTLEAGTYVLAIKQWKGIKTFSLKPYRFLITTPDPQPATPTDRFVAGADEDDRGVALANKAYALYCKKQYSAALPLYEQASELIPNCAAVWNDMGACCVNLNDLASAKIFLEKAISLKERYDLALRNRGVVARKEDDFKEYVIWTQKAVSANPDGINLRFLGHALTLFAKTEKDTVRQREILHKALTAFEKSYQLNPKDPYTKKGLDSLRAILKKD